MSAAMLLLSGCNQADRAAPDAASNAEQASVLHDDHMEHGAIPTPPPGELWPTDAPLRTAMTSIRESVEAVVPVYSQGTLQADDAAVLADQVEKDVQYMIENCQLEPEPDAALHVLIARMMRAANALRTDPAAESGVPQLVSVLGDYAAIFDHPGWIGIDHGH